jgi:hypothetical protein
VDRRQRQMCIRDRQRIGWHGNHRRIDKKFTENTLTCKTDQNYAYSQNSYATIRSLQHEVLRNTCTRPPKNDFIWHVVAWLFDWI